MNQDTQAVIERLDAAVATSGLSLRRFAHALGTSPSRLSSYRTGRVAPSAAFLLRAERIAPRDVNLAEFLHRETPPTRLTRGGRQAASPNAGCSTGDRM